jgi:hypothetical protein
MKLSILTVTKAEDFAKPFLLAMRDLAARVNADFVPVADSFVAFQRLSNILDESRLPVVTSKGFIESVLDEALSFCRADYVLRLDDDERCSECLEEWLRDGAYYEYDHWKFPRAHLWPSKDTYIANAPLWPDHQTRLSTKAKSGGRHTIHAGSPFGGGQLAPAVIEHHKFLVKSAAERLNIAAKYDAVHPGYGTGGFLPFNLPEIVWPDGMQLMAINYADWAAMNDAKEAHAS